MASDCPCGSKQDYLNCCGLYLSGDADAPTPESLMRSRYTAFVKRKFAYLAKTMHGKAVAMFNLQQAQKDAADLKWLKLDVLNSHMPDEFHGVVEFKVYFRFKGKACILHEISLFDKINGKWFYVDHAKLNESS